MDRAGHPRSASRSNGLLTVRMKRCDSVATCSITGVTVPGSNGPTHSTPYSAALRPVWPSHALTIPGFSPTGPLLRPYDAHTRSPCPIRGQSLLLRLLLESARCRLGDPSR